MNKNTSLNTLWDNDMVKSAKQNMSPEDLDRYKKIGELMYRDVDFQTSKLNDEGDSFPPFVIDAANYIVELLKSGIHPSMLEKEEIDVMNNVYGKEWYLKWNYVKEDLEKIVTIKKN